MLAIRSAVIVKATLIHTLHSSSIGTVLARNHGQHFFACMSNSSDLSCQSSGGGVRDVLAADLCRKPEQVRLENDRFHVVTESTVCQHM